MMILVLDRVFPMNMYGDAEGNGLLFSIYIVYIFLISLIFSMPFIKFSYYSFGIALELECIDVSQKILFFDYFDPIQFELNFDAT